MREWIEHDGNGMPVDADTLVDFKRRCDCEPESGWKPEQFRAGDLRWSHTGSARDIIAYHVITNPADSLPPPKKS